MGVSWWCTSSGGQVWQWSYTPLLGVWALIGVAALLRTLAWRWWAPATAQIHLREESAFAGALLALGAVSEWPVGPLGAGYLLSVGMFRFLVYTFVVSSLLLISTPEWVWQRTLGDHPTVARAARLVARWPMALAIANAVLVITHLPPVIDTVKASQLGSFSLDMAWLVGGIVLWLPIFGPGPLLPRLPDPARAVYLFGASIVPTIPASFLTFSALPLYGLYELAPPIWLGYDVVGDQRIAGLLMKIGGGLGLWTVIAVLFLRWANRQERLDRGTATEQDHAAELDALIATGKLHR